MWKIDTLNNSGPQGKWSIQFHIPSKLAEDLFFCVDNVGHYDCAPSYRVEREKYYSFLILCTIAGQGALDYYGRHYNLDKDRILFLNAYEPHIYYPVPTDESWQFYWLHFDGKNAVTYLKYIKDRCGPVLKVKDSNKFVESIASIYEYKSQKSIHFEMNASLKIESILNHLLIAATGQSNKDEQYYCTVDKALDYIKSNYQKELHIDDIAKHVHQSSSHFISSFKARTASTPYEYLINYRIMVSKMHLTHSDRSVSEIAKDIGFPSVNNFIETFKKYEGTTPYQYKKNNKSMLLGK